MALIQIVICYSLYQFILNSINTTNTKIVEFTESNTINPKINEKKQLIRELYTKEQIQDYINQINSYLKENHPCKIFNIFGKRIINNDKIEPKNYYFLEIEFADDDIKYYLYDPKYRKYAENIDHCKEVNIKDDGLTPLIFSEYYKNIDYNASYLKFFEEVKNLSNAYSLINKEPCYQVSMLDYYDKLKANSELDLYNNYLSLCDESCFFEGLIIEKLEIRCYCKQNVDMKDLSLNDKIIKYFENFGNFEVLQCYELLFNKNGQHNNTGSNIILALFIINIICIINIIISTCANKYYELILKYQNYLGQTIFDFKKIKDLNSIDLSSDSLSKEQSGIINDFCEYIENNTNKDKINNIKEEVIEKLNNGELEDYYSCVFYIFPEKYQKHIIEDEINDFDYYIYKKFEKRNFCEIMCSLFKANYDFFNTFFMFHHEDYKIYSIKVMSYINTLLFSLDLNISFYNDDTMHKIYIDNADNIERLPIIFLTNALSLVPSILYELCFSSYKDDFIDLKTNMDTDEKEINQIGENYYKCLKRRIKLFCIFSVLFDLFSWYYVSCFFAVYLNTQKSIFIDFIVEFLISLVIYF